MSAGAGFGVLTVTVQRDDEVTPAMSASICDWSSFPSRASTVATAPRLGQMVRHQLPRRVAELLFETSVGRPVDHSRRSIGGLDLHAAFKGMPLILRAPLGFWLQDRAGQIYDG